MIKQIIHCDFKAGTNEIKYFEAEHDSETGKITKGKDITAQKKIELKLNAAVYK